MAEKIINISGVSITTRAGKGEPITSIEMDSNLEDIVDGINLVSASLATSSANTSGTSGTSGAAGTSGEQGSSGTDGTAGTSGTDGPAGNDGSDGTSGTSGTDGPAGTGGTAGTSGTSGTTGNDGTSGTDGSAGTSGTNGVAGSAGSDGTSGTSGTSIALTVQDGVPTILSGITVLEFSGATVAAGGSGTSVVTITGGGGGGGTNGTGGTSGTSGTDGVGVPGSNGTSGTSGGGSGIGIFVTSSASGIDFETTSSIRLTQNLLVDGSITASAYKIEGAVGDPAIVSETNIILSASWDSNHAVIIKDAPLRIIPATRATAGNTPVDGDIYYDSSDKTIFFGKDGTWYHIWSGSTGGGGSLSTYEDIISQFVSNDSSNQLISSSAQIAQLSAGIPSSSVQVDALIGPGSIDNSQLANSSITINGTSVDLGSSITADDVLSGTGVISQSVAGISTSDFNQWTALQVFHTDGIQVTGSIIQGFQNSSIVDDPGALISQGYGVVLQEPNSKLRVGPNYLSGGDRDFVDIVTSTDKTQIISTTDEFRVENNTLLTSSISLGSGLMGVTGSLVISGSTIVNMASGSTPPNYFILAKSLISSSREFDLTMGYGTTGSYYIGSNLYLDSNGNFVKNNESLLGWKINFRNAGDGISDKLSFDYQMADSNENTSSVMYFNRAFDGSVQTNVNGNLTINSGDVTLTSGDLAVASGNLSATDLSLTGDITASGAGLFGESLVVSGSFEVVKPAQGGGSPLTSSLSININGFTALPHVSESLDYVDDAAAAAAGVPLGGIYRNGNFLMIRLV